MITTILYLLSCGGGLGFSLLVGCVGIFYLGVSKSRLEQHEEISIKSLEVSVEAQRGRAISPEVLDL